MTQLHDQQPLAALQQSTGSSETRLQTKILTSDFASTKYGSILTPPPIFAGSTFVASFLRMLPAYRTDLLPLNQTSLPSITAHISTPPAPPPPAIQTPPLPSAPFTLAFAIPQSADTLAILQLQRMVQVLCAWIQPQSQQLPPASHTSSGSSKTTANESFSYFTIC